MKKIIRKKYITEEVVSRDDLTYDGEPLNWEGKPLYWEEPIKTVSYPVIEQDFLPDSQTKKKKLVTITKPQISILQFLNEEPTVRTQDDVAEIFKPALNLKTAKKLLDDLINKGFVEHPGKIKRKIQKGYILTDSGKNYYIENYT
jgi:predicted transcriptional regulator